MRDLPRSIGRRFMKTLYRLLGIRMFYSLQESIRPICSLFRTTKRGLLILGGELNHRLYLTDSFKSGLEGLATRGIPVEIISGPQDDEQTRVFLLALRQKYPQSVHIRKLKTRPARHFCVVDGMHVKVEDPHEPYAEEKTGYVSYNTPRLARKLTKEFEKAWAVAGPYDT